MRLLLLVVATLIASVAITQFALKDTGYVLLSYGEWTAETSFSFFIVLVVVSFVSLYIALRLLVGLWRMPRQVSRWNQHRRWLRARRATRRGLIALAEGRWARAERELIRFVDDFDAPLLNYLGAARAAQKLGQDGRRDEYLSRAMKSMPDAKLAVGLTQAEVQLSQGQYEQALASLIHLRTVAPRHSHVLYLLKKLYEKLGSWEDLLQLLPDLRKEKVLDSKAINDLSKTIHRELLNRAAHSGVRTRLYEQWAAVPKALQADIDLVRVYAKHAVGMKATKGVERLLRDTLRKKWDLDLVRLYGVLPEGEEPPQLETAEEWLRHHPRQAELLLTAGRLALRNRLWGKARSYLEASIGIEERAETYCELANLLKQLGENDKAIDCYRKGLNAAVGGECSTFTIESGLTRRSISSTRH